MLEGSSMHPLPFQQMRGGGGGYVADMMALWTSFLAFLRERPLLDPVAVRDLLLEASMAESFQGPGGHGRAETTEAMTTLPPQATFSIAQSKMTRWTESLVDEQICIGSPMAPCEIHSREPGVESVLATLHSTLSLGLGYVSSQGDGSETSKLVALLDRVRASLPLHAQQDFLQDKRRRDRLKDVCRVVRAARKKGQRLKLCVNINFTKALNALREHHEDSWVGPALESVWDVMQKMKRVFGFELWLHEEGQEPQLIAADFGHAHTFGRAYYVATRKPLADLAAAPPPGGERVPVGVVFEDLSEDDLWGAAALKAETSTSKSSKAPKAETKAKKPKKQPETLEVPNLAAATTATNGLKEKLPSLSGEPKPVEPTQGYQPTARPAQPAKDDAKQQFLAAFQKLVSEGLSETEAAAKALRLVHG
ncbi:unnamed protein product [Symbiodinium sp. CCMP2592]|nr:unnamed protein product [Symbiodinium sp. CCMP2592]